MQVGDYVVHIDHGIGRYEGLKSIAVGHSPHDCVMLTYAGGDKLYVPVENIDVLSRYGSDEGTCRSTGWAVKHGSGVSKTERTHPRDCARVDPNRRRARLAAPRVRWSWNPRLTPVRRPFPLCRNRRSGTRHRRCAGRSGRGHADGPAGLRRCWLWQDRGRPARSLCGGDGRDSKWPSLRRRRCLRVSTSTNFVERFADSPLKVGRLSRLVPTTGSDQHP